MRNIFVLMFVVLLFGVLAPSAQRVHGTDEEHTRWIDHVMRDIGTLKPGMTRADVLRIFEEEGGVSTAAQHTYVYKHCRYIKVTFQFHPVEKPDAEGRVWHESPNDKLVSMSEPFLQWSVMD